MIANAYLVVCAMMLRVHLRLPSSLRSAITFLWRFLLPPILVVGVTFLTVASTTHPSSLPAALPTEELRWSGLHSSTSRALLLSVAAPPRWDAGTLQIRRVRGPCGALAPVLLTHAVHPRDCVMAGGVRQCRVSVPAAPDPTTAWCLTLLDRKRAVVAVRELVPRWGRDVVGMRHGAGYECILASGRLFSGYCQPVGEYRYRDGTVVASGVAVHASEWQQLAHGSPAVVKIWCPLIFSHVRFDLGWGPGGQPPDSKDFTLSSDTAVTPPLRHVTDQESHVAELKPDGSFSVIAHVGRTLLWRQFVLGNVECLRGKAPPPPPARG